jgi:hypothetical protein
MRSPRNGTNDEYPDGKFSSLGSINEVLTNAASPEGEPNLELAEADGGCGVAI